MAQIVMHIQFDLRALRDTKWHEYVIRFVFGGGVTVFAGIIAHRFGPVIGGIFLAIPAIFPASATLIEKHEKEKNISRRVPTVPAQLAKRRSDLMLKAPRSGASD